MLLNIQFLTGQKGIVSGLKESDTVADLKAKVAELDFAPPPAEQKLLFGGRLLVDDTQTLSDLDIFGETCIMCVSQPRPVAAGPEGGGGAAAAPAEPAAAAAAEPDDVVRGAGAEPVEPVAVPVPAQAAEAAPVVAQAAPELPVAAAAEAAAAAAAAAAPVEPEHEEMIALSLKTLRGTSTLIEVPAHATFGHIKHQYIQPIENIPAIQMRLIYMGQLTDDSRTPVDYNICRESFIHLVRRPNESIKSEVITKDSLRANCRWCNRAGVQLVLRPQCRQCGNEGIMYSTGPIEVGRSTWSDMENMKGTCFGCGADGAETDISMGFLCSGVPGDHGPTCPSRLPGARRMVHTYDGTRDLVDSLNDIFGYAHARGFEV